MADQLLIVALIDLLDNLDKLAENRDDVLNRARTLWPVRVSAKQLQAVELYGNAVTRKHIKAWMDMTTLQTKQLLGYTLKKRTKITPSRPFMDVQSAPAETARVTATAKKVIKKHRKVLIALRDR